MKRRVLIVYLSTTFKKQLQNKIYNPLLYRKLISGEILLCPAKKVGQRRLIIEKKHVTSFTEQGINHTPNKANINMTFYE